MKSIALAITSLSLLSLISCKKDFEPVMDEPISATGAKHDREQDMGFFALADGNKLDMFSTNKVNKPLNSAIITGLASGEKILAIDFRPATGQLFGLGSSNRLYVINPMTGTARAVGSAPFTPALAGNVAGFDFNPTVDRIRVVTSSGQNLRLHPETGAVVFVDGSINGAPGAVITSVAYTNNEAGATTTTLYDIDVATDKLYRQDPPNAGTLVLVGDLGVDLSGEGGFDIAPARASENDKNISKHMALALYSFKNKTAIFSIDLETGRAKALKQFDKDDDYYAIAIPTNPVAFAVSGNSLLIFNPEADDAPVMKNLTGLQSGETVLGIDFRPATGQLFALGSNSRLYVINTASGAAAFVAALTTPLNGTSFGFDFNPVVDRIRIVSNTGQNLRVVPTDGTTSTDAPLNPGTPAVSAAAYTNNFAGTTSTQLFVIDFNNDKLFLQSPPNNGTLAQIGALGINVDAANGFDIGGTSNMAYGLFTSGSSTQLYSINLSSGSAKSKREFTGTVNGLAIGLGF
jgi:hypothetical protein